MGAIEDVLTDVSRETMKDIEKFEELILKWTEKINLISKKDRHHIRARHTLDSLQLCKKMDTEDRTWLDVGSGGGFPGLVVSIYAKHEMEDVCVTCIEADMRKSAFLRVAIEDLNLPATVVAKRLQDVESSPFSVISARALASLDILLKMTHRFATNQTKFFFPKGVRWNEEVVEARKDWRFNLEVHPSGTQEGAALLELTNVSRV